MRYVIFALVLATLLVTAACTPEEQEQFDNAVINGGGGSCSCPVDNPEWIPEP